MYERIPRLANDSGTSPESVAWHVGNRSEFATRVKRAVIEAFRQGPRAIESLGPKLIEWLSDPKWLHEAWNHLATKKGSAPGPNGRRYSDLDKREVWSMLQAISEAIRNDTYRIGEAKEVKIPKDYADPSRGTRSISLLNIEDRVVQRTAFEILDRLLDPIFGRGVLGYRPRRGRLHALALAEHIASQDGRYVFVVEDIKNAFTQVPLQRLQDVLAFYVPAKELLHFVGRLLQAETKRGLRQGSPLSPLLMNLYLHHFLDQPWQKTWPTIPMIRVADDILLLCRTKKEAGQARKGLEAILKPIGMPLKATEGNSIHDFRKGDQVKWLGFMIGKDKQGMSVTIAEKAWGRLEESLMLAHMEPDSSLVAAEKIDGWIDQMGPCQPFVEMSCLYKRLTRVAGRQGFDEIPSRDAITSRLGRAHEQWIELRETVHTHPEIALSSSYASYTNLRVSAENRAIADGPEDCPAKTDGQSGTNAPWE